MIIYSDLKNKYQILDYHITHSRLLLRNMKSKDRDYNIDILFKPINFLVIPNAFNGIEISIVESNEVIHHLNEECGYISKPYDKLFSIKNSEGKYFYISAMAVGVFHNNLAPNESSIKGIDGEFGKEILWYNGK